MAQEDKAKIGLIGLGTMGSALALNIAEKGFPIAVWNRRADVTRAFHAEAGELADRVIPTESYEELVAAIEERFGIAFDDMELREETFASVGSVVALIHAKQRGDTRT